MNEGIFICNNILLTGGPDFRTLLNSFGGGGGGGSLENTALTGLINQFRNSGGSKPANDNNHGRDQPPPSGQYGPSGGQYAPSNPAANQPTSDDGSNFLSILGNLAKSQIANQLLQRALQKDDTGDSVSNRRYGGVFSENPSSGSHSYPTQPPYTPNYPTQSSSPDVQRSYRNNNAQPTGLSGSTEKPVPYGWNV